MVRAPGEGAGSTPILLLVRRALDDLETLVENLSARSDHGLMEIVRAHAVMGDRLLADENTFFARIAHLQRTQAEAIAADDALLTDLIRARDLLNAASWPASADTFRLTAFYSGQRPIDAPETLELFRDDAWRMRRMRRTLLALAAFSVVVLVYTILLSSLALNGRMLLQEYRDYVKELEGAIGAIYETRLPPVAEIFVESVERTDPPAAVLPPTPELFGFACDFRRPFIPDPVGAGDFKTWLFTDTDIARKCGRYDNALRAVDFVEQTFPYWGARADALAVWEILTGDRDGGSADGAARARDSQEVINARLTNMTMVLLPLYGFLGAAAFVFRQVMRRLGAGELTRTEVTSAVMRLALGTIIGGVMGLFFGAEATPISIEPFAAASLGLPALALLAGYGVEVVFSFFDRLIGYLTAGGRPGRTVGASPGAV